MKKIWLIVKREYLTRVRKRAFIVTTLVVPVLFVAAIIGMAYISGSSEENLRLAVKDDSGLFENKVRGLDKSNLTFRYFDADAISKDSLSSTYQLQNFDGLLYIPPFDMQQVTDQNYLPALSYYSSQTIGYKTKFYIESELSEVIHSELIRIENLDKDLIAKLDSKLEIQAIIGDKAETGSITEIATAIGYLVGFIIYIYLFAYGAMVMRSVMEEKTNRIVEVIITTVRPFQLMMGKILGIGLVGFTQLLIWAIVFNSLYLSTALIISPDLENTQTVASSEMIQMDEEELAVMIQDVLADLDQVNWLRVISSFIFYFLFGYILYASMFAAVGAAASDDGDVQTLMFPISIPIIISIVIMMATIEQPNSGLAVWSSMIPFTSPVVMMSRIPFDIPFWSQQIPSMIILFCAAVAMVWLSGRIYRIGILIQGQKASFGKIWKWMVS